MSPVVVKLIANFLSVLLAPAAKAAWAFLRMKFKIGKNNTSIEKELEALRKALDKLDDDSPITEQQRKRVINAARDLIRDF